MKKVFKITGAVLLTVALACNVQYALCDYYNIKKAHLNTQVWAQTKTMSDFRANGTSTDADVSGSYSQSFANNGVGAGTSGADAATTWVKTTNAITCANTSSTVTYTTTVSGSVSGSAGLGASEGGFSGNIGISGTSGNTASYTATLTVQIVFPTNADGTPIYYNQTWCHPGGSSDCIGQANPCISLAMQQITKAVAQGLDTSNNN
jgi:hypothetical protein